jgi:hypothetical protein
MSFSHNEALLSKNFVCMLMCVCHSEDSKTLFLQQQQH